MQMTKWLAIPVGLAALAACNGADEAENVDANVVMEENLAPPADANLDMNLGNDMNNVVEDNTIDGNNTVNAY
jgi:uncharacterized protein YcfL